MDHKPWRPHFHGLQINLGKQLNPVLQFRWVTAANYSDLSNCTKPGRNLFLKQVKGGLHYRRKRTPFLASRKKGQSVTRKIGRNVSVKAVSRCLKMEDFKKRSGKKNAVELGVIRSTGTAAHGLKREKVVGQNCRYGRYPLQSFPANPPQGGEKGEYRVTGKKSGYRKPNHWGLKK